MALPNIDGKDDSNKNKGLPTSLPENPDDRYRRSQKSALPDFEGASTSSSIPDFSSSEGSDINDDDDAFERMSFDEQAYDDERMAEEENNAGEFEHDDDDDNDFEEEEPRRAPQRPQRAERPRQSTQKSRRSGTQAQRKGSGNRSTEGSQGDKSPQKRAKKRGPRTPTEQIKERGPLYVDEDKKQLKTFGTEQKGKDGKRKKVTPSKFDNRNNLRKRAVIVQGAILTGFAILAFMGTKNALFPPDTLEQEEVLALIHQVTGDMNFPTERGSGFVENFMETFISVDDDDIRQAALNYFYTGEVSESYASDQMNPESNFSQQVAYGPVVYDYNVLSAESAEYIVGVAVSTSDDPAGIPTYNETTGETNVQWRFFSVNVYYDAESDAMAIVDNSPNIMPPQSVFLTEEVPEPLLPGTQEPDEELTAETRNAVQGFINGYMDSSLDNTSLIDQYIYEESEDEPFFLTHGLDGEFELYGEEPVTHTAFYADNENPNHARALVEVSMRDTSTGDEDDDGASNVYNSQYMMRLMQSGDGTWYVTQFRPSLYTPASILEGEEG